MINEFSLQNLAFVTFPAFVVSSSVGSVALSSWLLSSAGVLDWFADSVLENDKHLA
jgi:hypothetical protein